MAATNHGAANILAFLFSVSTQQGPWHNTATRLHALDRIDPSGGCHGAQLEEAAPSIGDASRVDAAGCQTPTTFLSSPFAGLSPSADSTLLPASSVPVNSSPPDTLYTPGQHAVAPTAEAGDSAMVGNPWVSNHKGFLPSGESGHGREALGSGVSGGECGAKRRRLQPCSSWGEDDLEFLRILVTDTDNPATEQHGDSVLTQASPPVLPRPPEPPRTPGRSSPVETPIHSSHAAEEDVPLEAPPARDGTDACVMERNLMHQYSDPATEVTAEEKLQATDAVAALLWRASPRLRDRLLAVVNDTWAKAAAELEAARDVAAQGVHLGHLAESEVSPGASEVMSQARRPFREILMERLEATRRAVELELEAADKAAAIAGTTPAMCSGPQWLGVRALRGDIREKLMQFQACARNRKQAEITANARAAKARGATREDLLSLLDKTRRELYTQAIDTGLEPMRHEDRIEEIDKMTEGLLEQLNANHQAVQEDMAPASCSAPQQLRESLQRRLSATRAAAEAELMAADAVVTVTRSSSRSSGSAARDALGLPIPGGADVAGGSSPVRTGEAAGIGEVGDASGGARAQGVTEGTARRRSLGEGSDEGGDAAEGSGKRKRKPSSGGRRCKHEGW